MKKIKGQVSNMYCVKRNMESRAILALLIILGCLLFVPVSEAVDSPHNPNYKNVNCESCHVTNPPATWWTDQGSVNGVCQSCHSGAIAQFVKTHSSGALSSAKYGDWTNQCTACHNPHNQRQFRVYKNASYVQPVAASTAVTATTLTKTGAGWSTDQWAGHVLLPNVLYQNLHYRILSNTSDTITIDTGPGGLDTINLAYIRAGQNFGISYGMLMKETVNGRIVRLFNNTSANNFADANNDGTRDGICEVCHTQTKSATNLPRYRYNDHQDVSHTGVCTDCHKHNEAFAGGGCNACHGYPPETDVAAGPAGLVWAPEATGSSEGTAHVKHSKGGTNHSYACETCHYNGMPATPVSGNNKIQIGFNGTGITGSPSAAGSTYTGQALSPTYSYEFTNGTAAGGPQFQCSNVYCHGVTPGGNNWGSGADTTPMWNATVACGDCHKATNADTMTTGSHTRHTGTAAAQLNLSCATCHSTYTSPSVHANGFANVAFSTAGIVSGGTYTGTATMFDAFGNCTNIYCHSSVQGNNGSTAPASYAGVQWGAASVSCDSCHGLAGNSTGEPVSGSHTKHVTTQSLACDSCHKGYGAGIATHADYTINLAMDTTQYGASAAYSQPAGTPRSGFGSCSSISCHGSDTPVWGSALANGCESCHLASNALPASHGSHYNDATRVTSNTTGRVASTTLYKFNCGNCHDAAATQHAKGNVNANRAAEISFADLATAPAATYAQGGVNNTDGQGYKYTIGGGCSSTYCHGNFTGGLNATPTWGGAAACGTCHKYTAADPMTTGSHTRHVGTSSYVQLSCSACHADSASGFALNNRDYHVNKSVDWNLDETVSGSRIPAAATYNSLNTGSKTSVGGPYNNCMNVYCHSIAQTTAGGSLTAGNGSHYKSVQWGSSAMTCSSCHDASPASGSHSAHLGAPLSAVCADCHTGSSVSTHVDGSITFNGTTVSLANYGGDASPGNANFGACSTSLCHGSNSGTWGAANADTLCVTCHGVAGTDAAAYASDPNTAAPGYNASGVDTNGDNAATDSQVGAHDVHLRATSNYSDPIACGQCHTVPAGVNDAGHFGALPADLTFGTLASANGLTPSYSGGNCSNVYCHGAKMPNLSTNGTGTTPSWTDTAYLNGTPNISGGDCDKCHGSAPTGYVGSHSGSEVVSDCNLCHTHVNADGSFANKALHINGVVDAEGGNCAACHGAPPGTGLDTNAPAVYAASHAQHYSASGGTPTSYTASTNRSTTTDYIFDCGNCHSTVSTNHIADTDGYTNVMSSAAFNGTYTAGTYTAGGDNGPPPGSKTFKNSDGSCSNVYCHGNFQGSGLTANAPTWGNAASGDCGTCHNASNTANVTPRSGSHEKHVDVDQTIWSGTTEDAQVIYNRGYECTLCHKADVGGTGPASYSISDKSKHANTFVEWQFNTADSRVAVTSAYSITTGASTPSNGITRAYGSCSNVYCHSIAQTPAGGALTAGATTHYSTVQWGATVNCGGCHKSDGGHGVPPVMDSGSHTKHLSYSFTAGMGLMKCDLCHRYGTDPITNSTECNSCHQLGEKTMHVNGAVNVIFETNFVGSGTWNGTPAPGDGFASSTCSTTYCHSNAQGAGGSGNPTSSGTPTWGSAAMNCGSCHVDMNSSASSTGSHTSHAQGSVTNYACAFCHNGYTESTVNTTTHVNRLIELSFSSTANGTTYSQGAASSVGNGYGTCSASACHGTANNSPQWGSNTNNDTCTKCHGTPSVGGYAGNNNLAAPGYNGTGKDLNGDTAATDAQVGAHDVHLRATNLYSEPLACSSCHALPADPDDAGHFGSSSADMTFSALASSNGLTPGYDSGTGSCSNVYCHGAKLPSSTSNGAGTSPVWNNTAYLDGVPGLTGDCDQCHATPPPSAVHTGKVLTDCNTCHPHVNTDGTFSAGATSRGLHINGRLDGGGDNCIDCHSSLSAMHATHTDSATILSGKTLSGGDYGKYSGGGAWWYTYTNTGGTPYMGCGYCHPQSSAAHMTGSKNLNFDPADTGAAGTLKAMNHATQTYTQTPGSSVTCSSVYCHSNGYNGGSGYSYQTTPDWFGGTFAGDKCGNCHGNYPNDAGQKTGSAAHTQHAVGIHYDDLYTGTTGLMSAGAGTSNSHGNASYSTTINCNICHVETVTMSRNKFASLCNTCHNGDAAGNALSIAPASTRHINGTAEVYFSTVQVKSKAQVRNDITTVAELNTSWTRTSTANYKSGATPYDQAKNALNTGTMWNSGTKTCSNIACHNSNSITWSAGSSCLNCHTNLPQ